ncbi:MAG TPA: hypothetical protein VLH19_04630 [Patescibacteria group bacterium]|nr:hypothetical protein [Patescibacteria group bacterium]
MKKVWRFIHAHELIFFLLAITTLFRVPSLLEPYWYGDEMIYLTVGNGISHGLELYKDIHDNKTPLIYILASVTGTVFWFRFLLMIWVGFEMIVFYLLCKELFGKSAVRLHGIHISLTGLALIAFAILPFFAEGLIANGEIFMLLPTLFGFLSLVYMAKTKKDRVKIGWSIIGGLSFSAAFLFKAPAAFDTAAAGFLFFILFPLFHVKNVKDALQLFVSKTAWVFVFAFLVPILISLAYYAHLGVLQQYVTAAFAQNVGYLSSWQTGSHQSLNLAKSGLVQRGILLAIFLVVLLFIQKKISPAAKLTVVWFGCSLFAALLSERPYPHYLIQVIPSLALALALLVEHIMHFSNRRMRLFIRSQILTTCLLFLIPIVFAVSYISVHFWQYPLVTYYENYGLFVTKQHTFSQYLSYFDPRLPEIYRISSKISMETKSTDQIFAWGDLPVVYALTKRLPVGRYTSAYHINDFNAYTETITKLRATPPKFILVDRKTSYHFSALFQLLSSQYAVNYSSDNFILYKRY